jgi:hypothetical protein
MIAVSVAAPGGAGEARAVELGELAARAIWVLLDAPAA